MARSLDCLTIFSQANSVAEVSRKGAEGKRRFAFAPLREILMDMSQPVHVTIRRATPDDASLLADLGARTFQETFAADNTADDMATYLTSNFSPTQQAAELAHPDSTFLIAEVEGIAAGYAKLHVSEPAEGINGARPIELVRLYVSSEWFGRGVGEALMRSCLDESLRAGYETIWLGVWERNARAQAFYNKWDFRAVGEHIFQLGSDTQRDILMERSVAASMNIR